MAVGAFTIPFVADFFLLEVPPADYFTWIAVIVVVSAVLIDLVLRAVNRLLPDPHAALAASA